MRSLVHLPLSVALALGALALQAQSVPPPNDSANPNPSGAADSTLPSKAPPVTTASTAAMLAASMPKYNPPKPVKAPAPEEKQVDLREIDKPKNGIIRLPNYVVRAQKPPIFREKDLYTKDGLTGVAMQRYAGLNLGPFADLNAPIALAMYQEDQRLKDMQDISDTAAAMSRGGDSSEADYIRSVSQDTYAHQMDFGGPVPQNPSAHQ